MLFVDGVLVVVLNFAAVVVFIATDGIFSDLLIIYRVKTKVTITITMFGYLNI